MGSGSSTNTSQQTSNAPWAPQQGYITGAFQDAQNQYNQNMAQGAYSGNYVAPTNQAEYDANNNAITQAQGNQGAVTGATQAASGQIGTGLAGATSALSGLGTAASTDPTASNIADAQQYASGLNIPGQVQAAMQGANQEAADSTLPNLYRGAAASGNINSDRTAISQGVVQRGLAQQAAGLTAQLGNSAYQTGIGQASTDNAQQLQALSQQGSLGSNLASTGQAGVTSGVNNQGALDTQASGGAQGNQALDQSNLNNNIQQYNGNQNFGWQQLQNLNGIVGTPKGTQGTTTGTTQQDPSLLSTLGSATGVLGSLFKGGSK